MEHVIEETPVHKKERHVVDEAPVHKTERHVIDETLKKKRGRKPSGKIIDLNKVNIGSTEFSDCIIAHLPLSQKDIAKINNHSEGVLEKGEHTETPSLSININDDVQPHTCARCEEMEKKLKALQETVDNSKECMTFGASEASLNAHEPEKLIHCMNGKTIKKVEPKEGESVCWWCCHRFNTIPIGLPEKYDNGEFHLFGHFCSFNCAHAYNVQQNDFKIWERYSLLNLYYKKIFSHTNPSRIMPAPPRQALQMFGGELSIEQFRHQSASVAKEYRYMLPPYVSANGMIEEIHKTVNKLPASTNLKLKRNKPLPGINNNLLQLMKKT